MLTWATSAPCRSTSHCSKSASMPSCCRVSRSPPPANWPWPSTVLMAVRRTSTACVAPLTCRTLIRCVPPMEKPRPRGSPWSSSSTAYHRTNEQQSHKERLNDEHVKPHPDAGWCNIVVPHGCGCGPDAAARSGRGDERTHPPHGEHGPCQQGTDSL